MKQICLLLFLLPGVMLCQDYTEIDAFARSVKFSKDYKTVAQDLAKPYQTDEEKVRAIFTWITHHISYDERQQAAHQKNNNTYRIGFESEADLKQKQQARIKEKIERTLKKQKGVCQDYAWLFQAMLAEVGIECAFVSGYGRNNPMQMGRVPRNPDHAWNAAKLDGEWALFDLTWSTDVSAYGGNGFFMMPPAAFYRSHFPSDQKWLLMDSAPRLEDWSNQMFWHKCYSGYKVQSIELDGTEHQHYEVPYNRELNLTTALQPGLSLYALKSNGKKPVQLEKGEGNTYTFRPADHRMRGSVVIAVLNGKKLAPLMEFKVR